MPDTSTPDTRTLVGRRVLITEDEAIIAMDIEQILEGVGCEIVAIARTIEQALSVLSTEIVDLALLDVNLGGTEVFPVAATLREMEIPFFFLTGYSCEHLPDQYKDKVCLEKPIQEAVLLQTSVEVCSITSSPSRGQGDPNILGDPNESASTPASAWPPLRRGV